MSHVTFVRKIRFGGRVHGIPGEWDLELAVRGTPHPLSGMILNLVDIDQMIRAALVESTQVPMAATNIVSGVVIADAVEWLEKFEKQVLVEIKRLTSESESLEDGASAADAKFVSAALNDGVNRFVKRS